MITNRLSILSYKKSLYLRGYFFTPLRPKHESRVIGLAGFGVQKRSNDKKMLQQQQQRQQKNEKNSNQKKQTKPTPTQNTNTTGDFPFFGSHLPDPFPALLWWDGLIFQILQAVTPRFPEVLLRRSDDGTTIQNHIME